MDRPQLFSWPTLFGQAVLALIYFCAGTFGLSLAFLNPSASAVWPPTGLALAALLLWGYRLWPGVWLGAFWVNVLKQGTVATALGIATGNTLEAVLGAWLVQQFAQGTRAFEKVGTVFSYITLAAVASTTISATVGVTWLCMRGFVLWPQYGPVWLTWWLGDMTSDLTIAPLLLIWSIHGWLRPTRKQLLEALGITATVGLIGYLVFLARTAYSAREQSLEYLAIPPLVWAALRFGPRGAVSSACLMSALAVWGTCQGLGPFATPDRNASLLLLQAFMAVITVTALVLAAVVSERKQAELNLAEARDHLAEHARKLEVTVAERTARLSLTNAELEAFCYSLSHDLRAPLRAINSFTHIVLSEYSKTLDPGAAELLNRVVRASQRLDRLIQDVLALSRLSLHHVQTEVVNVEKLVREIIQERPELQDPNAEITIEGPLLPVLGHEASLTQCLTNLLSNAVKFVAAGVGPKVHVRCERNGKHVRLWVADNGIGIQPEAQQRIFQIFQRLHTEKQYEGTGIGLAIVRKAVNRMGGEVGVESEPGKGSKFWIELPAA